MFAVAPPPDAEGESAVSLLLSELDNASALHLLRSLLARSDAVRDLAFAVGRRAVILFVINEGLDERRRVGADLPVARRVLAGL